MESNPPKAQDKTSADRPETLKPDIANAEWFPRPGLHSLTSTITVQIISLLPVLVAIEARIQQRTYYELASLAFFIWPFCLVSLVRDLARPRWVAIFRREIAEDFESWKTLGRREQDSIYWWIIQVNLDLVSYSPFGTNRRARASVYERKVEKKANWGYDWDSYWWFNQICILKDGKAEGFWRSYHERETFYWQAKIYKYNHISGRGELKWLTETDLKERHYERVAEEWRANRPKAQRKLLRRGDFVEARLPKNADDFESVCEEAMRAIGFRDARRTPKGPDGGVDVLSSTSVAQAKMHLTSPITPKDIRALLGSKQILGKEFAVFFAYDLGYSESALVEARLGKVVCYRFDAERIGFVCVS